MSKSDIALICAAFVIAWDIIYPDSVHYFHEWDWNVSDMIAALSDVATLVLGGWGLCLLNKRTKLLEKQTKKQTEQTEYLAQQTKNQIEKGIEDRFHASIGLLGGTHTSGGRARYIRCIIWR